MDDRATGDLPADLERLRRRFERWRNTHRVRSRISDSLWAAAAKLAGSYGICRTAKALRVGYYSLKARFEQAAAGGGVLPSEEFFPLPSPATTSLGECIVEWEDAAGSKMRVCLKGFHAPDLATLGRSFWNSTP
jgi:hypothetical protein